MAVWQVPALASKKRPWSSGTSQYDGRLGLPSGHIAWLDRSSSGCRRYIAGNATDGTAAALEAMLAGSGRGSSSGRHSMQPRGLDTAHMAVILVLVAMIGCTARVHSRRRHRMRLQGALGYCCGIDCWCTILFHTRPMHDVRHALSSSDRHPQTTNSEPGCFGVCSACARFANSPKHVQLISCKSTL